MPLTNVDASGARPISKMVSTIVALLVPATMMYAFIAGMNVVKIFEPQIELTTVLIDSPKPTQPEPPRIEPTQLATETPLDVPEPKVDIDTPIIPDNFQPPIAFGESIDIPTPSVAPPVGAGPTVENVQILRRVDPVYPSAARRDGIEGSVLLTVVVGPNGRVTSVAVARSSGNLQLDDAAMSAVRRWTFTHPKVGSVQLSLPVSFRLERGSF